MQYTDIRFPHLGIVLSHVGRYISIGNFQIMFYGIIIACGFLAGLVVAQQEAKRTGQNPEIYMDYLLWMMIPAIIGARIYYVVFSWDAAEIDNLDEILSLLGEMAEECIDLDLLLEIGEKAEPLTAVKRPEVPAEKRAKIAVAWDKAFCFYYKENLEILEQLGAELCYFSPVNDVQLPEGSDGIYLGGGYPETYRRELAENVSMKESICEAAKAGKPIIAECGGFMYVCNHLVETDDSSMEMLGLIDTDVHMTKRLSMQFGYVTLNALCDTAFFKKNTNIRAHEFHYSKADKRGDSCEIKKYSGKCWNGLYVKENIMAGYPHFYFHNCREVAERFVDMAEKISKNLSM